MEEIRPCPFCGGEADCDTVDCTGDSGGGFLTTCKDEDSGCAGVIYRPNEFYPTREQAIAAWNTRALSPAIKRLIKVVKMHGCTCTRSWPRAGNHEDICFVNLLAEVEKEGA